MDAAGGIRSSRETFALFYGPMITMELAFHMRRPVNDPDVEDGVQEVLLECLRSGGALDKVDATKCTRFRAFLGGITRNVGLRILKRRARQPDTLNPEELSSNYPADLSALLDETWRQAVLGEALTQLVRESQRTELDRLRVQVLRMRFEDDLRPAHIATVLGLKPERVHALCREGKEHFRLALLDVVCRQNPMFTRSEVQQECLQLLGCSDGR